MTKQLIKRKPIIKAEGGTYLGQVGSILDLNNLATQSNVQGLYSLLPPSLKQSGSTTSSFISSLDKSGGVTSALKGIMGDMSKDIKPSKFSDFINKDIGNNMTVGSGITSALSIADQFIPQAEDTGSKIASGVFDTASQFANFIPGGQIVSPLLKGLGTLFGAGVKNVKGNAAMDTVDSSASYTGADALDSKRFGILGLGKAKKYKNQVAERQQERETAAGILNKGKDDLLASTNVQQMQLADNLKKNASDWMYNIRAGEFGMKIKEAQRLSKQYRNRRQAITGEPAKAGTTETPQFLQNGNKIRSIEELVDYAKKANPRFVQRMSEPLKYVYLGKDKEGNDSYGTHLLGWAINPDGSAMIYSEIQEDSNGNLKQYSSREAIDNALKNKDYLIMSPEEAKIFTDSPDTTMGYKSGWKEFFSQKPKFKDGGTINVIPEGALHARKHHLEELNPELEGITKKGIPVISQGEGGEVIQQAEVERSEIIFRLEVTNKLEELRKRYKETDSQEEKDTIAIEAGKLLTQEIMENTKDNTGELLG